MSIFIVINQNIPPQIFNFSYLNFKNFPLHMYKIMYGTKIVCSTNKKQKKKKKKKKKGEYNSLLTHFICGVNMIVSMFTWAWDHGYRYDYNAMGGVRVWVLHVKKSWVRIRDQVHGYRYKLSIRITMGRGTTSLVGPFQKLGYRFVHEGRLCRISF